MSLTWTEPGDVRQLGTAAAYQVRYSTTQNINDNNDFDLNSSTYYPIIIPGDGGTLRNEIITGLIPGGTYYWSIRAVGNHPAGSRGGWQRVAGVNQNNYAHLIDLAPPIITGLSAS